MTSLLNKLVSRLQEEQTKIADAAMRFPRTELFEHGVVVGRHQGIQIALEVIDDLLNEANQQANS